MLLLALCGGCTHLRLQKSTVDQGRTLTGMQQAQILDNLAMFACNPYSVAWHVKVTGGLSQVSDQGAAELSALLVGDDQLFPLLAAQRNVLDQWNLDTVIEPDELELLGIAYRKAIDPFDAEGTIRHDAFHNICQLASEFHIVLAEQVAMEMIDVLKHDMDAAGMAKFERIQVELRELYRTLDEELSTAEPFDPKAEIHDGVRVPNKLEFVREEIIKLTSSLCDDPFYPPRTRFRTERNIGLVEQAQDRVSALVDLVRQDGHEPNPYSTPWLGRGCKKDVPCDTCYVGHYRGCEGDCYVWVLPGHEQTFRDFILLVLSLVPPDQQDFAQQPTGAGAAFSPNF